MRSFLLLLVCVVPAAAQDDYSSWGCGNETFAIDAGRAAAWPRSCAGKLRFWMDSRQLGGMEHDEFERSAMRSLRNCSAVSGLKIGLAKDVTEAHVEMRGQPMRSGTLAYCYFPAGDCGERLACRFNSNVKWTDDLFSDTLTHELGHAFGLPHTQDRRDIMYPSIIAGRELDASYGPHYSIPQLVARYGEPAPEIPPTPSPGPPGVDWWRLIAEVVAALLAILTGYLGRGYAGGVRRES